MERALAFGNVDVMTATLEEVSEPVLRNALLERIATVYYRQRSEPAKREGFYRYANRHLEEIPAVLASMAQSEEGRPESAATFKMMAIAMAEDKRYDEAIAVCKTALSYGLDDGTKTGFEGRIARLVKKRAAGA